MFGFKKKKQKYDFSHVTNDDLEYMSGKELKEYEEYLIQHQREVSRAKELERKNAYERTLNENEKLRIIKYLTAKLHGWSGETNNLNTIDFLKMHSRPYIDEQNNLHIIKYINGGLSNYDSDVLECVFLGRRVVSEARLYTATGDYDENNASILRIELNYEQRNWLKGGELYGKYYKFLDPGTNPEIIDIESDNIIELNVIYDDFEEGNAKLKEYLAKKIKETTEIVTDHTKISVFYEFLFDDEKIDIYVSKRNSRLASKTINNEWFNGEYVSNKVDFVTFASLPPGKYSIRVCHHNRFTYVESELYQVETKA